MSKKPRRRGHATGWGDGRGASYHDCPESAECDADPTATDQHACADQLRHPTAAHKYPDRYGGTDRHTAPAEHADTDAGTGLSRALIAWEWTSRAVAGD